MCPTKGLVDLGGWIGLEKMAFQVSWRLLLRLKIIKISFRKAKIPKFFAPADAQAAAKLGRVY